MRSKWRQFLFIGLILSLVSSTIGCGESYTQKDLEGNYKALLLENTIIKSKLETIEADVTYLRDTSKTLRDDYDTLKDDYDTLKADSILYDTALAAQIADYNSLKANYDTLQALYNDVSNKLADTGTPSFPVSTPTIIESYIDGTFEGWDGDTVFKLRNGQIWEQASYSYIYHYAYSPEILIYSTSGGYKMIVNGVSETIYVRRLK